MKASFFAFRTALLPFQAFADLGEGWVVPQGASPEAWAEALAPLRARLQEWISRPDIREAVFLASPDLEAALVHWEQDPEGEKGLRAERSLMRYFARMCGRSTPFGLFAGCSLGRVGDRTRLEIGAATRRHTRLDTDYLFALTETLARDPAFRVYLRFLPNSSLYRAGGRLRYVEARLKGKVRTYHLVAVDPTDYLEATLRRAEGGATLEALAQALVEPDLPIEETRAYLEALAEAQVLVPEWTPPVTGDEVLPTLLEDLADHPGAGSLVESLREVDLGLEALDAAGLGSDPEIYRSFARRLEALPVKVELGRLFQVDLHRPSPEATLGTEVLREMEAAVTALVRLAPARPNPLRDFAEAFEKRFEGREVPLAEALDEEVGLRFHSGGESSPLLEGMPFPGRRQEPRVPWSEREACLAEAIHTCAAEGSREWVLTEEDLRRMETPKPQPLPGALSVMAKVGAKDQAALDAGDFQLVFQGASGPSGANLLGRFCQGDPELAEAVRGYFREEEAQAPEAIHAEIVHLPEGRIGNVIQRPCLREWEIPFLGRSGAPKDRRLEVSDLRVSVRSGRVRLTSARLGREVRPRLATAHNYMGRSVGIYRFLAQLQHQDALSSLAWSWGPLDGQPFLPRVRFGRTVFSPAAWRVRKAELAEALKATGLERWTLLQAWREGRGLPRFALLADGDNQLPVDFQQPLSVESFLDVVKGREVFTLEEMIPGPEALAAHGPEGTCVQEVVVPFLREVQVPKTLPPSAATETARDFPPGSEWLYIKLYAGAAACDQLLREVVGPLVEAGRAEGWADGWFFLRYEDPDRHLRLRIHGDGDRLLGQAAPLLHRLAAPLMAKGLLWKIQFDTYVRELERYGQGEAMELVEGIFQADSDAALALCAAAGDDAFADLRWRWCLLGLDRLLADLGLEGEAALAAAETLARDFGEEHGLTGDALKPLSDRFRRERAALQRLLEGEGDAAHRIFARRSETLAPLVRRLRALEGGPGAVSIGELAGSLLHMHANRMLRSAHRAQEALLYAFLQRSLESRLARARKGAPVVG